MARAVLCGVPHHLTQRGVDRQEVFANDADREVYLALVSESAQRFGTLILGYCLMSNHVHWVVGPRRADSLARTFGVAHGRYAAYANARRTRSGHFWQNRFFSCSLDRAHLWTALRYVERNPVRAELAECAAAFRWSSAVAHTGAGPPPVWLEAEPLASTFTPEQWGVYLKSDSIGEAEVELRRSTYTGRPVGSGGFTEWAESMLGRRLVAQAGGRPKGSGAPLAPKPAAQCGLFEVF